MEPSAIWSISMEGPALVIELSTIWGLCVEGSALDIEPSMMRGVFVEGSGLENGTFHGFGPQRGWFGQHLRPTASRKHQRAGILPQLVVDRVCGQSAWARLQSALHRMLTAERRKRLQIAITAACSLNNMSDCTECSATIPSTRMRESR